MIKIFGEKKIKMSNELYLGLGHVMWRVYWAQTPGSGGAVSPSVGEEWIHGIIYGAMIEDDVVG